MPRWLEREVNAWGSLVTLVAGGIAALSFVVSLVSTVTDAPWYAKGPFFVSFAILLLILGLRIWAYLRRRRREGGDSAGGIAQTLIHMAEGAKIENGSIDGNTMTVVQAAAPVEPYPALPSSPELLEAIADELDAVRADVLQFLDRWAVERDVEVAAPGEWHAAIERSRETSRRFESEYVKDLSPRVLHAYEQAREHGFPDEHLERLGPMLQRGGQHFVADVASRYGVLAERIRFTIRNEAS